MGNDDKVWQNEEKENRVMILSFATHARVFRLLAARLRMGGALIYTPLDAHLPNTCHRLCSDGEVPPRDNVCYYLVKGV